MPAPMGGGSALGGPPRGAGPAVDDFRAGFESGLRGPEPRRDEAGEEPLGRVRAVPCEEPHKSEVFYFYDLDPEGFETQRALDREAVQGCLPVFEKYIGVPYRRSTLETIFFSPDVTRPAFAGERAPAFVPQMTASGSRVCPVGPIWISVPISGQTPQS